MTASLSYDPQVVGDGGVYGVPASIMPPAAATMASP